jgi:hypothetical protein
VVWMLQESPAGRTPPDEGDDERKRVKPDAQDAVPEEPSGDTPDGTDAAGGVSQILSFSS